MSIEQTSQLIQLILNSLLLLLASTLVLVGLSIRLHLSVQQLQATYQDYLRATYQESMVLDYASRLKAHLQLLRSHYRQTHYAVLAAHYALLVCGGSTLTLAARTLVNADWLINLALGLFVLGGGLLLLSVGLALLDLWRCHKGLLKLEVNGRLQNYERAGRLRLASAALSKGSYRVRPPDP